MNIYWRDDAVCGGMPADLLVGPYGERDGAPDRREAQAKRVCGACPVTLDCLEFSFTVPVTGIFGGLNDGERLVEAARRGIRPWCVNGLHRLEPGWVRCWPCKAASDARRAEVRRLKEAA